MRGFGPHVAFMPQLEDEISEEIRRRLNGEQSVKATPEEIREQHDSLVREEAEQSARLRAQADGDAFTKLHPEYSDTIKNASQLMAHCKSAFGTTAPTLEQMDSAYQSLRANGSLELNQRVLAKQADEAAVARARQFKAESSITEEEMKSMPLEELIRRGMGLVNNMRRTSAVTSLAREPLGMFVSQCG